MCARVGGCYCNSILCARVRVRRVCEKGKNRKKRSDSERGGNRALLLPPSLSHFQPALNFDPPPRVSCSPDLLEALRRGAHNFPPRHQEHLQQQKSREKSQGSPGWCRCRGAGDGAELRNVHELHLNPPESRGDRRTSATCQSAPRCAVAGVRRCGSSVLGTEGAVQQLRRRSPGKRSDEGGRKKAKRDP